MSMRFKMVYIYAQIKDCLYDALQEVASNQ